MMNLSTIMQSLEEGKIWVAKPKIKFRDKEYSGHVKDTLAVLITKEGWSLVNLKTDEEIASMRDTKALKKIGDDLLDDPEFVKIDKIKGSEYEQVIRGLIAGKHFEKSPWKQGLTDVKFGKFQTMPIPIFSKAGDRQEWKTSALASWAIWSKNTKLPWNKQWNKHPKLKKQYWLIHVPTSSVLTTSDDAKSLKEFVYAMVEKGLGEAKTLRELKAKEADWRKAIKDIVK